MPGPGVVVRAERGGRGAASGTMMVQGLTLLLALVDHILVDDVTAPDTCLSAAGECSLDPDCSTKFHTLKQCAGGSEEGSLQLAARNECMTALFTLQSHRLFSCKCERGMKKEKNCLRIFWTMHQSHTPGYDELAPSPYEHSTPGPSWGLEHSRLAFLMTDSARVHSPASVNHCLDAAKVCNVDENCKQFRTDYAKNCLKPATKFGCNRHKCHKSLRRFFDLVPEEYKYAVLFCPCEDSRCAERRRQTIVPACSFEESEKQNCLRLQDMCREDLICRSRLTDFQTNCQPSKKSASSCFQENHNACLQSYTGLIGTILTPNYVSNSSSDVSIWCTCANSGNQHQECENLLSLFTSNKCLVSCSHSESFPSPDQCSTAWRAMTHTELDVARVAVTESSINWYTSSMLFDPLDNERSPVTTTQHLGFSFLDNDTSPLHRLDSNKDCDRGKLKASQEKSMPEKITDCNANAGTNSHRVSLITSCTLASFCTFIAIVENAA